MNKLKPHFEKLPNGLTLVLVDLPGFHSLTNFLVIRSGSRYEDKKNNGVAHFLEHMVFKGTTKYPDKLDIAQSIEGVGGYFNAWTSNDHTAYWNTVPLAAWQRGIEVPFELAFNAILRKEDLEHERGVIIEEIRRMNDDPSSQVEDQLGEILFPNHPLGLSVIGTEERIEKMTIEQFKQYRSTYYHPAQALFICVGNIGNRDIKAEVVKLTKDLKETGAIVIDGGVNTKKIEQTLAAIDEELASLRTDLVGEEELAKAKALIVGSFEMSADRPIDLARWY